jgi:osmoprotectant transport system substrate-binding protein
VVVASFDFPESEVLAQLYGQTLLAHDVPVRFELDLGARELVMPALIRGLVDVVPEYAGAALEFLDGGSGLAESDEEATYAHLQEHLADVRLTALTPSPAQDQNAFAVTRDTAARLGLKDISDLSAHADELVLGGPPECPDRPLCLLGLERTYDLSFREFVPLDSAGTVASALADGAIDVGVLFSTDGTIRERRLVALRDDLALQPAENVVPVVRDAVLDRLDPNIRRKIDRVSRTLTTVDLRLLNARMQFEGATAADVARDWLSHHDLAVPASTTAG